MIQTRPVQKMTEAEMRNINYSLLEELDKSILERNKLTVSNGNGLKIMTLKKYECFMRIYFGKKIDVLIRFNTLNNNERINWTYVSYETCIENLEEYKKTTLAYLKGLILAWKAINYVNRYEDDVSSEDLIMKPCEYAEKETLEKWLNTVTNAEFAKDEGGGYFCIN